MVVRAMRLQDLAGKREHLLVRGRLTRDDVFVPRRCGSTMDIHKWPEPVQPDHGDVIAETRDAEGLVLRTEMPRVESEAVCSPEPSWRVRVYLPLDEEAVEVVLRRGDRVLWATTIGEAPDVSVEILQRPTRADHRRGSDAGFPGGQSAVLALERTRAHDREVSYAKVVYRWAERGFRTIFVGPARSKISIPADRLPGGERCEFFVVYSNGVRSAIARTEPFELAPIGPVVSMSRPSEREKLTTGAPLELECLVQHPEAPSTPHDEIERTRWFVDGEVVAIGMTASVGPLPEGEHRVEVRYAPVGGEEATFERVIGVATGARSTAAEWEERDPFAE